MDENQKIPPPGYKEGAPHVDIKQSDLGVQAHVTGIFSAQTI
jgi:hypothetical protein